MSFVRPLFVAFALACMGAVAAAQSRAPLSAAIAATSAAARAYAFDVRITSSQVDWRADYIPSRAEPKLRLVSPARSTLTGQERNAFDRQAEETEGLGWCADVRMGRVASLRLLREDADTQTYAFQPTRESSRERARDYASRLRGEMVMSKATPDILSMRIYAPRAFDPIPLVRISALDVRIVCAPAPNGRRYAVEAVTTMRGSAFGRSFDERTTQRVSNVRAP